MSERPRPVSTDWSQEFWRALREDSSFLLQRCSACAEYAGYPKIFCPNCYSSDLTWAESTGRGVVYTFSTVAANPPSTFIEELPYTIAIVQLDEGPRFLTRLVGVDPVDVRCDMPVKLAIDTVDDELAMPLFEPA
jgi:uncharacterized OB-fold protein